MASLRPQKVVVVGAGPVGALAALYAAERGDDVELYELRGDLRDASTVPLNFTKSINLAVSERGIHALRSASKVGLVDSIMHDTLPMYGRMIHGIKNGTFTEISQAYDVHGQAIYAADRGEVNRRLLDALDAMPNVKFFFNHKLTGADFRRKKAWFERRSSKSSGLRKSNQPNLDEDRYPELEVTFDLMIGADGAHSATRYHMMKFARVSYQQEYIDALWCEFHISAKDGGFALSPNHLHIWPGRRFMFIAIPSSDKSFTCTLFAPQSTFADLDVAPDETLGVFFKENFPGVYDRLISAEELERQYTQNPHLPLISIKCHPYHFDASCVIVGDAAHAMVPFYGQGMNCGLEDVRVLFDFLDGGDVYRSHEDELSRTEKRKEALQRYTNQRGPDAATMNDLALENYWVMRSGVTSPVYKLQKYVEELITKYIPSLGFRTEYNRVSFGNERYSRVKEAVRRQEGIELAAIASVGMGLLGLVAWMVVNVRRGQRGHGLGLHRGWEWVRGLWK